MGKTHLNSLTVKAAQHSAFIRHSMAVVLLAAVLFSAAKSSNATVYYVSATGSATANGLTWATASSNLQAIISGAQAGDQVWVEAGDYGGALTANPGVALYGGFNGTETSLSQRVFEFYPTQLSAYPTSTYTIPANATGTCIVNGFWFANGGATLSGSGAAIYSNANVNLQIANCIFDNNMTALNGAAIYASGGSLSVTNCTFNSNEAISNSAYSVFGGAIYASGANVVITGTTFSDNQVKAGTGWGGDQGGALYLSNCTSTISECNFVDNVADNIGYSIWANGEFSVSDCQFSNAGFGIYPIQVAVMSAGSSATAPAVIKDCLFTGGRNTATAISVDQPGISDATYLTVSNDTFANLSIGIRIGPTFGSIGIANSLFEGDLNVGIYSTDTADEPPSITLSHNDLYANGENYYNVTPGATDLALNPLFVNSAANDYHLMATSPLIDSGDDSYVSPADLDLDFSPRISGTHVDIGSYEYQQGPSLTGLTVSPTAVPGSLNATGTVTLSGPAPAGGIVINVSANPLAYAVPAAPTVTVPAGSSSANFTIYTAPGLTSPFVETISASYNDVTQTASLTVDQAPPIIAGISFFENPINGGTTASATIQLTTPALAGGATVTLSSSKPSDAVPAVSSITIRQGLTSGSFSIYTPRSLSTPVTVTISATYNGVTTTAPLTIDPVPYAVYSMSVSPSTVLNGTNSYGTVTINRAAPAGGILVYLPTGPAAAVPAVSSLTIPAGSTSAMFKIYTVKKLSAPQMVPIWGKLDGGFAQTAILTVDIVSSVSLVSMSISPPSLKTGLKATGTVAISGPAPAGGVVVYLSSNYPNDAIPAVSSVTIPAGSTSATFTIDTPVTLPSPVTATISGLYNGVTQSATLQVTP